MKGFIKLTEYDGYRMAHDKIRVQTSDIVQYKASRADNTTLVTIRGQGTVRVGETPDMIDRLIDQSEKESA